MFLRKMLILFFQDFIMLLAISENKLIPPTKKATGKCPLCNSIVVPKCGEINIHHWAHKEKEDCDSWTEPETYWHKSWKESFPLHNREVVVEKNNKKHFADLLNDNGIVIELQNSNIDSKTIKQREAFYGEKMLWVINGSRYRERIYAIIYKKSDKTLSINNTEFRKSSYLSSPNINDFLSICNDFIFTWSYPVKVWAHSKRPIFIDIDEDYILWFYKGIGTNYGKFKVFTKKAFFEKYKGDFNKYHELNKQETLENYSKSIEIINNQLDHYFSDTDTYNWFPGIYLKVYSNVSKKTYLNKVRFNELIIPNGNSLGLYFLFCYHIKKPNIIGVGINYAKKQNIRKHILSDIYKDEESLQFIINDEWTLDYIASIPLNKTDIDNLDESIIQKLNENIQLNFNKCTRIVEL